MDRFLITFRSITFAQRGERTLQRVGIGCTLRRTPRALAGRGCGYCLHIRGRDALAAVELLRGKDIAFGKVYAATDGGMEEREL